MRLTCIIADKVGVDGYSSGHIIADRHLIAVSSYSEVGDEPIDIIDIR